MSSNVDNCSHILLIALTVVKRILGTIRWSCDLKASPTQFYWNKTFVSVMSANLNSAKNRSMI
jgi:hypothetical protein